MRVILFVLALTVFFQAHAEQDVGFCFFGQTLHGQLTFKEVEFITRFPKYGLYQGGRVTLKPWVSVGERATIGIDQNGQLLNVIELDDRTIAFRLSGERKLKDLFFAPPRGLWAIDSEGQLLEFSWDAWDDVPVRSILKRTAASYAFSLCSLGTATALYAHHVGAMFTSPEVFLPMGLGVATVSMVHAWFAVNHFEVANNSADGLVPTGLTVDDFRFSEAVHDETGNLRDYDLIGRNGQRRSLRQWIDLHKDNNERGFDLRCEHALLPRGIPPERYSP